MKFENAPMATAANPSVTNIKTTLPTTGATTSARSVGTMTVAVQSFLSFDRSPAAIDRVPALGRFQKLAF
jgi:hypothetical protein